MIQTFVKILILLVIVGYIFYLFHEQVHFTEEMHLILKKTWRDLSVIWIIPVLLIFVNWAFEALKWKCLVKQIEKISFMQAYEGVLTGLSVGFVTSQIIGDAAGRILQLTNKRRSEVLGALVVSRAAQLFAALFFGGIGLFVFTFKLSITELLNEINYWFAFIGLNLLLIILFLFRHWLLNSLKRFRVPIFRFFLIIKSYNLRDYQEVIIYSFLRYLVFTLQFIIVFYLYGVDTSLLLLFCGISLVFLTKSLIISFNFVSNLGMREASALFFLGKLGVDHPSILLASLTIWILNIIIPTCMGAFIALKMKFQVK